MQMITSNQVTITVAALSCNMTASLSISPDSITVGQEIVFYPSSSGCSESVTYDLYQNGAFYASITSGQALEPSSAGTYTYYVVANCSNGCSATSNTVTVTVSQPEYSLSLSSNSTSIGSCGGGITLTATLSSPTGNAVSGYVITFNDLNMGGTFTAATDSSGTASVAVTIPDNTSGSSISWEFDAVWNGITSNSVYVTQGASGSDELTITFTETGLPSGTQWCVITDIETQCSTSDTITVSAYDGSTYNINVGSGWQATPSSGAISCSTTTVPITFSAVQTEFTVTFSFSEQSDTDNYVTFNGVVYSSSTSTVTIPDVPNGSYSYSITATYSGKLAEKVKSVSPSSGTVTVNDADVTVNVTVTYEEV